MIDIANKAGLSKGLVYFYYANKEDLYLAVLEQGPAMNLRLLEATLEEMKEADGLERSLTLLERFLEMGEHAFAHDNGIVHHDAKYEDEAEK